MSWFRLDDKGAFHAKVLAAGNEAYGAWCRAGQWCAERLTDGKIPRSVAMTISNRPTVWKRLEEVGLVEKPVGSDFVIHDYLDWNPSGEEVMRIRAERSASGRMGGVRSALTMASKRQASAQANAQANGKQTLKQTASKPQANDQAKINPVPVPRAEAEKEAAAEARGREGAAAADPSDPPDPDADANQRAIRQALEHPAFAGVADKHAVAADRTRHFRTLTTTKPGFELAWFLAAIAEAASDSVGVGLTPEAVVTKLRKYTHNPRAPKAGGAAMTNGGPQHATESIWDRETRDAQAKDRDAVLAERRAKERAS